MFGRFRALDRVRGEAKVIAAEEAWGAWCVNSRASSAPGMEEVVHRSRRRGVDARRLDEVLIGGAADRFHGAEMVQQGALAVRADARDLVERALRHLALALRPVGADRETVRLVAQPLDEIERRVAR